MKDEKPDKFEKEPVLTNSINKVKNQDNDAIKDVTKKDSKAKKQKKDKENDASSIEVKPNTENIKESNPKRKSAQKEIEHSIVNDAELIQKLEETLLIKKRSRSRSRGDKFKNDSDAISTASTISNKSKNSSKVNFEDLDFKYINKDSSDDEQKDTGTKSLKNFACKLQNLGRTFKDEQRERKVSNEQIKYNKIKTKEDDEDEDEFLSIKEYKKINGLNNTHDDTNYHDEKKSKDSTVRKSKRQIRREQLDKIRSSESEMLKELGKEVITSRNDDIIDK